MNLADIESDLSAFHRIDEPRDLPAQRFIDLAVRLPAYRGIVRARIEAEEAEKVQTDQTSGPAPSTRHAGAQRRAEGEVSTSEFLLAAGGDVEYSRAAS